MNRTRIVLLGLLAVLVAVWVSSATLPPPSPPAPVGPATRAPATKSGRSASQSATAHPVTSFDLNEAAERLRARVDSAPHPQAPARNPFEFEEPRAPRVVATALPAARPPIAYDAPAAPPFTLAGIAEHQKDQRVERTAILTNNGHLYYVRPGDLIDGRWRVNAVGADAVEVQETTNNQITRLGLR